VGVAGEHGARDVTSDWSAATIRRWPRLASAPNVLAAKLTNMQRSVGSLLVN
jgi:hypothetical protein